MTRRSAQRCWAGAAVKLSDELLDVTVIALQRNSGFALACNSGVLAADTPEVCLLNSDVLPIESGWLQPLFRTRLMVPQAGGARCCSPMRARSSMPA